MIPGITASTIYSKLGNESSLVPLAIKDIANSCGLTTASYLAGQEHEGKDRFIDEFGTQAIWLFGIPTFNIFLGKLFCLPKKLDYKIDARILKDKDILKAAQEFAPTEQIKNSLKHVEKNAKTYKGITIAKFITSTTLTALTYFGLTKFRHKYTEKEIEKEYYLNKKNKQLQKDKFEATQIPFSSSFSDVHKNTQDSNSSTKVSFTGGLQEFMFDPVKNLMILDGVITGERLSNSRNTQDLNGYIIKEGSFWVFMYGAGKVIASALEKHVEKKYNKSIDLDARIIESKGLKDAFTNGTVRAHLEAFKNADKSNLDIYKYAVNPKTENLVIDMAKKSDVVPLLKLSWFKKSDKVDTRQYVDIDALRGIQAKIEKLVNQFETSGQSSEDFFKALRKLKRGATLTNIGSCIAALGVVAPAILLLTRKFGKNTDYQLKKDIEEKLDKKA